MCLRPQICARCAVPLISIHTHLTPSCYSPLGALDEHLLHIHQHCSWCTCTQTWHDMHPQWKHITNHSQHTFSVAVPCTTRSVSPHLTPQIFPTATSTIYPIAYLTATPSQHVCICSCASHVTSSTTHHSTSQHEWRNASQDKVPLLGYMGNVLQVHLTLCPFTGDVSCG